MITNEEVYAGTEIINETINEVIISDSVIALLVICILAACFHYKMWKKINDIESKLNNLIGDKNE
jgi:signal transduction histidine kinase